MAKRLLDDVQVTVIRELINEGVSMKEIQMNFGITRSTIHAISANYTYKEIQPKTKAKKGRLDIHRFREGYPI